MASIVREGLMSTEPSHNVVGCWFFDGLWPKGPITPTIMHDSFDWGRTPLDFFRGVCIEVAADRQAEACRAGSRRDAAE